MRLAGLIFVPLLSLHGQDLPDASTLLERSEHALDAYHTYQFQLTTTNVSVSVAGMNPGKIRIEFDPRFSQQTVLYDGQSTWTYAAGGDTYFKEEGKTGWADSVTHVLRIANRDADVSHAAVREGTIDVDGEARDCWVIERTGSVSWPGPGLPSARAEIQQTIWIDKSLWIDWQVTSILRSEGNQSRETVRKTQLKLNPDFPESMFSFTPPPGSRERFPGIH